MLQLESRLQARFPHWFRGRRAAIARPLLRTIGRWSGFGKHYLDAQGAALPMPWKQPTGLCGPGGARFLAFGVDPAFSGSIDGLIEVDLHRVRPRKRERYLSSRPDGALA